MSSVDVLQISSMDVSLIRVLGLPKGVFINYERGDG